MRIHPVGLRVGLLILLLGLAETPEAQAIGPYLEMSGFPTFALGNTTESAKGGNFDGTALANESGFGFDLRNTIGVQAAPWVMLGMTYNYMSSSSHRDATPDWGLDDEKVKSSEWGATVGFFLGNFRLLGTYLFSGSKTWTSYATATDGSVASDAVVTNKLASGYQFVLGYSFLITPAFRFGPSLAYRRVTYKSQTVVNRVDPTFNTTDQAFTTRATEAQLLPMISMILSF